MRTEQKVFNDLIETIVRNSENNIATITDVKLWAKNWQTEMEQELTLTDVGCSLPDESEMMRKRYKEYHLAIKNVETIQSGSFYSGFRRCWSWLKSYELVED